MIDYLTINETLNMFKKISIKIIENEPLLTQIDLKTGDGDHGTGMKIGFQAVLNMLEQDKSLNSIQEIFKSVGMKLIDTMGGVSGVLFGTLFISGISKIKNNEHLTLEEFQKALNLATDAIMERGGAYLGDKTMIDALMPAVCALKQSCEEGLNFKEATKKAYQAAKDGVDNTKKMLAKKGRAMSFREKSIGYQDAGATSIMLIFSAIYESI